MAKFHGFLISLLAFCCYAAAWSPFARGTRTAGGRTVLASLKTNAQRFARGLGPLKPTRTYEARPHQPRTSGKSNIVTVINSVIAVYKCNVTTGVQPECYVGSFGKDTCVDLAHATIFKHPDAGTALPLQQTDGEYFALKTFSADQTLCPSSQVDLGFCTVSTDYGPNQPPSGPGHNLETDVWNVDSETHQVTATWTNAANANCASASVYLTLHKDTDVTLGATPDLNDVTNNGNIEVFFFLEDSV